jgi:aldose 1-epimerase
MKPKYSVHSSVRGGARIFTLQEAEIARAEIAPEWGNNCFLFYTEQHVLEPVSFEEFSRRPRSYGIPILFPFPNRIKDGKFEFNGKRYEVNPKQHGFVRDKKWTVMDSGASDPEGAWILSAFDTADYPEILSQFPFPFRLRVLYRIQNGRLNMETTVQNSGSELLPFGFGIHPYFRLPENGSLCVPAHRRWELVDAIPTGKKLDVEGQYDLREPRDAHTLSLDDIFTAVEPDANGLVRCVLKDNVNRLLTIVQFDANEFPEVVAYTVPAPRRAICIEPYTCPTDAFNLQNSGIQANVIQLAPQSEARFSISIYTESEEEGRR